MFTSKEHGRIFVGAVEDIFIITDKPKKTKYEGVRWIDSKLLLTKVEIVALCCSLHFQGRKVVADCELHQSWFDGVKRAKKILEA